MSATAAGVNGHQPGMLIRRDPHVGTEASAPPSEATQHAAVLTSQRAQHVSGIDWAPEDWD